MKRSVLLIALMVTSSAFGQPATKVPSWDARGVGPLPRMGITSLDVSDDGKAIAVGTFAAPGDPNVIVLNADGKIVKTYKVGQRGINQVAFLPASHDVLAVCTMPAGRAGDRPEVFHCQGNEVIAEKVKQEGVWFFHYGDHSNHPTLLLARAKNATAILAGNQVVIHRKDKDVATIRLPVNDPDATVSIAVDDAGWAVVGATSSDRKGAENLFLIDPDQKKPVWSRPVNKDVLKALMPEKGKYGTPTLPDGTRKELPQRGEPVWAPLSVAIHSSGGKRLIAAADYQGWQRWVRSSATMRDDNQGQRFLPTKPTITAYDGTGKIIHGFTPVVLADALWGDLHIGAEGKRLRLTPHVWNCRGLAGRSVLPTDKEHVSKTYFIRIPNGKVSTIAGQLYNEWVFFCESGKKIYDAHFDGRIRSYNVTDLNFENPEWTVDLNKLVPKSPKPWVANARATPIVPGVWQIPGGRVESDLGGQRVIEAPDGLILIEGHAGLSFEREWAAMEAVGLDPRKVKYVLATHEHGDHAPGAYLWRVVTGAKFVCSEEMAYTLQHHIPLNTGYGLHPPVPTDIVIKKDTELDLAGLKVRAIRIPGHTAGSMAWYFEIQSRERKRPVSFVAFGDLIMPRGVLGYAGSVNFSATDILSSLRKLKDLKVDYVLPGHGAVEGPENYFHAGIDVGQAVGWGFIRPEKPDPRFRITQKNVVVVGWGHGATSAAFGDVNEDGKPDVVIVCPDGDGSVVKIFLNKGGKFDDQPNKEIKVPSVAQPHKVRVVGDIILVAGKTAAFLGRDYRVPKDMNYQVFPFDLSDGNHLRLIEEEWKLKPTGIVSRRFGGAFVVEPGRFEDKLDTRKYLPDIDGPYVDVRQVGNDLLTSYGQLYRKDKDKKFPKTPTLQLPREKDWQFLAVGDFNGDGKKDAAFLSYGMEKQSSARVFYGRDMNKLEFGDKADAVLSLGDLLAETKKGQKHPLVRDTPVVADWNGDGIDDLIVAHGQSDEVLVFLGGKDGLSKERVPRSNLEYRVHYEHGVFVGDFNGDGKADLAVFGYTNTGVGAGGPPAVYVWLQQ
ncbi:MAG: VCBS repeat-containing protein [Planctomycetes bacterium]|nr:VCBS repeat-containing protein [Planctomycetota bacterium]